MIEVDDDPVALKSSHPLARRPLLAAVTVGSALLLAAIAMARSGARKVQEESLPETETIVTGPAEQAAEEVIRGMEEKELPVFEQPLGGPALEEPEREAYQPPPLADIEPSAAEEELKKALSAPSKIAFETQRSFTGPPTSAEEERADLPSMPSPPQSPAWPSLADLGGGGDQSKYAQKAHFVRHGADDWPSGYLGGGRQSPLSPYELKTGSVIPAVMISGINSDLPGQILAQVSENIFDTATGRHLLIPQGAKLVGTYDNEVAFAQKRALVIWTKLIFPDASQVDLQGMPGADPAGYAGFKDKVNRHVGRRIGAALLMTVFNLGFEVTRQQSDAGLGNQTQSAVTSAVGQSIAELGRQMVEREMEVPNTLEVRPGYRFNVMVNKDIAFQSPYRAR
jgi:type IV secretory pathway VirB10-like protein